MDEAAAIELAKSGLMLALIIAGPMLFVSLIVGVVVGLFQALTQIQEMTLTFVPKLLAIGIALLLSLPAMGQALDRFMHQLSAMIVSG